MYPRAQLEKVYKNASNRNEKWLCLMKKVQNAGQNVSFCFLNRRKKVSEYNTPAQSDWLRPGIHLAEYLGFVNDESLQEKCLRTIHDSPGHALGEGTCETVGSTRFTSSTLCRSTKLSYLGFLPSDTSIMTRACQTHPQFHHVKTPFSWPIT